MDDTGQTLASIGIYVALIAGFITLFVIWGIRDRNAWRKRATAHEFNEIKRSVLSVERNLDRLDDEMGRIECRLEQRSDSSSWAVRTLRLNLARHRSELTSIASTAEREATKALD